uniref:Transposase Tc1-like domain-containing protein n=1 Tax=Denticeps clupeoides TaxID=299321 RepID=A0AAY4AAU1_9TELE
MQQWATMTGARGAVSGDGALLSGSLADQDSNRQPSDYGVTSLTTRSGDRTLRKIVEKDRFQTLGDLRKQWTESGVETSRATVHRRVQEMGYRCRIPQVKPLLNQKPRQKRVTWATEKQHWTVVQWSKVLFSDESKVCILLPV